MKRIRVGFLIVGAGLAGSITGFLLKKAGADVLALELLALELLDAKFNQKRLFALCPANVWTITAWNVICKQADG